ncbi:hypothetical protein LM595_05450 [Candidatus Acetothermia bacterium]|jgi:hypothetical protein|nr:hypothetical protein [Candidatus Acetothermia bacterium]
MKQVVGRLKACPVGGEERESVRAKSCGLAAGLQSISYEEDYDEKFRTEMLEV